MKGRYEDWLTIVWPILEQFNYRAESPLGLQLPL